MSEREIHLERHRTTYTTVMPPVCFAAVYVVPAEDSRHVRREQPARHAGNPGGAGGSRHGRHGQHRNLGREVGGSLVTQY